MPLPQPSAGPPNAGIGSVPLSIGRGNPTHLRGNGYSSFFADPSSFNSTPDPYASGYGDQGGGWYKIEVIKAGQAYRYPVVITGPDGSPMSEWRTATNTTGEPLYNFVPIPEGSSEWKSAFDLGQAVWMPTNMRSMKRAGTAPGDYSVTPGIIKHMGMEIGRNGNIVGAYNVTPWNVEEFSRDPSNPMYQFAQNYMQVAKTQSLPQPGPGTSPWAQNIAGQQRGANRTPSTRGRGGTDGGAPGFGPQLPEMPVQRHGFTEVGITNPNTGLSANYATPNVYESPALPTQGQYPGQQPFGQGGGGTSGSQYFSGEDAMQQWLAQQGGQNGWGQPGGQGGWPQSPYNQGGAEPRTDYGIRGYQERPNLDQFLAANNAGGNGFFSRPQQPAPTNNQTSYNFPGFDSAYLRSALPSGFAPSEIPAPSQHPWGNTQQNRSNRGY